MIHLELETSFENALLMLDVPKVPFGCGTVRHPFSLSRHWTELTIDVATGINASIRKGKFGWIVRIFFCRRIWRVSPRWSKIPWSGRSHCWIPQQDSRASISSVINLVARWGRRSFSRATLLTKSLSPSLRFSVSSRSDSIFVKQCWLYFEGEHWWLHCTQPFDLLVRSALERGQWRRFRFPLRQGSHLASLYLSLTPTSIEDWSLVGSRRAASMFGNSLRLLCQRSSIHLDLRNGAYL